MVSTNLLVLNLTVIISVFYAVRGQRNFDVIRQKHGIEYLQYVGLIPRNIKCNKWGYRRTQFDFFKLEIVCLQYPKIHEGTCPIWQDCHQWYHFYNYFPTTCSHDDDCQNTCKCCYSPCFGTLTCRPAIIRPTATTTTTSTTTEANTKTTSTSTTTTTRDVASPSSTEETNVANELDYYDSDDIPPGPHILQEEDDGVLDKTTTKESVPQLVEPKESESKVPTTEPSLIRPQRPPTKEFYKVADMAEDNDDEDDDDILGGPGSGDHDDYIID